MTESVNSSSGPFPDAPVGGGAMLRLLPWTGPDGKPCYLRTDDEKASYVSRLADNLEAVQLGMAVKLLGYVEKVTTESRPSETELGSMVRHLSQALRDAVRIADSRGKRLPAPDGRANVEASAVIDREIMR